MYSLAYREMTTEATQASLPDIADLTLSAGTICEWSVGWFPDAHLDDTASPYDRYASSVTRTATVE